MIHILDFPNELLNLIFEQNVFDARDLLNASHTCHQFREVIEAMSNARMPRILDRDIFESALQMRLMAEHLQTFTFLSGFSCSWQQVRLKLSIHENLYSYKASFLARSFVRWLHEGAKHWPHAVRARRIGHEKIMFQEESNVTVFETMDDGTIEIIVGGTIKTHSWRRKQLLRDVILPIDLCSDNIDHKFFIRWCPGGGLLHHDVNFDSFKKIVRSGNSFQQVRALLGGNDLVMFTELFAREVLCLDA